MLTFPELLDFLLFDWGGIAREDGDREPWTVIIGMALQLAGDKFLPHHRASDIEEPWFDRG